MDSFRADRPLSKSITLATRLIHARLNKLIVARLPLALPPRADDPSAFLTGLLHITPIYAAFEDEWLAILDAAPIDSDADADSPDGRDARRAPTPLPDTADATDARPSRGHDAGPHPGPHEPRLCARVRALLQHLHLPGLMRAASLRTDIRILTAWSDAVIDEQLRDVGSTAHLAQFLAHIRRAIANRPHVLLAYAYVLYMALFAGGRYIRASLESAGAPFWAVEPSPPRPTLRAVDRRSMVTSGRARHGPRTGGDGGGDGDCDGGSAASTSLPSGRLPLGFLHFNTLLDGEDLRQLFKDRLAASEAKLTAREKAEVVQESICIFENMALVVSQLDALFPAAEADVPRRESSLHSLASLLTNPLAGRFRDSVAVTKERRERDSSKRSSGHDDGVCPVAGAGLSRRSSAASLGTGPGPGPAASSRAELCPVAMSKSMRFDKALPLPARSRESSSSSTTTTTTTKTTGSSAVDFAGSLKAASRRLTAAHAAHWVLVAAFGVVFLGAMLTRRRGAALLP